MTIDQLAGQITTLIIPVLPYLVKGIKIAGEKAAGKIGDISADKTSEVATKIWHALQKKGKVSSKLSIATEELTKTPDDEDYHTIMVKELKSLLETNPDLVREISMLLQSELPDQTVFAKDNIRTEIDQTTNAPGKQNVEAIGNRGLVIRQNIKK